MRTLLLADLRSRWRSLAALASGCFVLLVALCGTYSAYGGANAFANTFGQGHSPRLLSAISGSSSADIFTPAHFVAFGFAHPLFLVLALGVAITSGVAAIAADVETGRSELLFTAPIRRTAILDTRLLGWFLAELFVVAAGLMGTLLGSRLSSDLSGLSLLVPLRVVVQFGSLAFFAAAVAFAASARVRSRGGALGVAVGVVAGSYVANLVALLWDPLSVLRHFNPFGYYSPTAAASQIDWADVGVLVGAGVTLLALARYCLNHRDLA